MIKTSICVTILIYNDVQDWKLVVEPTDRESAICKVIQKLEFLCLPESQFLDFVPRSEF
jgi:hypothetical protein